MQDVRLESLTYKRVHMKTAIDRSPTVAVLNRMLQMLCRSLPMYLKDAKPWSRRDQKETQAVVDSLVADQEMYAARLADLILDADGRPDAGVFPIALTSVHDLSLDYLLDEVIRGLCHDVATLRQLAAEIPAGSPARALAEEIAGNAQGHLEILQGMAAGKE
jgi:hypothetical protein